VKILKEAVRKHGIELKGWIWGRDFKIGYLNHNIELKE